MNVYTNPTTYISQGQGSPLSALKTESMGIPGGPEVRTWTFHCQVWVQSRVRKLRFHGPHGQKQRKKRQKA